MIDTGCQVTILATSMFERMCAADPQVRSRLRPCGRRLVSADSSTLTVKGKLELNVVFPGLSCDMLFLVASIGSDGLLVVPATPVRSPNGAVMGGRPINITIKSAETDP